MQLDRVSGRRKDAAWLAEQLASPAARVVLCTDSGVLVVRRGSLAAATVHPSAATGLELVLLGLDEHGPVYAAEVADATAIDADAVVSPLRGVLADASRQDAALLAYGSAMAHWHRTHRWCGRCGDETVSDWAGHLRRCSGCGAEHFPRTDPAVIMLVVDERDRVLLGRGVGWPEDSWSALAGFVEPGETLEMAVAREVHEESGVVVDEVRYHSSQPWPFPGSLMLGFFATAAGVPPVIDPAELEDARWWSRAELAAAFESGAARRPTSISIASTLLADWLASPAG
ncbi:MAG TPA: NAD(+) diphosphatase [Mycobacteriales bacterium]|nr:NAD(+) diphosphatase [Mycobacteriales bacterium]